MMLNEQNLYHYSTNEQYYTTNEQFTFSFQFFPTKICAHSKELISIVSNVYKHE